MSSERVKKYKPLTTRITRKATWRLFRAFLLLDLVMFTAVLYALGGENLLYFPVVVTAVVGLEIVQLIHYSLGFGGVVKKLLAPLSRLSEEARAAVSDPLHARLSVGEPKERAEIAAAVNEIMDSAAEIHESYGQHSRFVSDASHELRTPIAVIQGYANMLDRWGKDDPNTLLESIQALKKEADGMQNLVEQLLFLSRGDNGGIALTRRTVDVRALTEELCQENLMIDDSHRYSAEDNGELEVSADAGLLKQALRTLIDNARKYTPDGGEITLSYKRQDGEARLSVQDTGIGIPADDVPRVFDRFFRSDVSRARKTGGSGLGLSIAKWIVDRHGGTIEVLSRVGAGTRITFVLPL
ncbi:hypothetical protein FACS1894202_05130 [Clostridia bacterium]|nr:hypothetical protein FACS1894202_05130 [Clostridia bacterium]